MFELNLSNINSKTKVYLGILCALSLVCLGYGVYSLASFTLSQFAVLAVAMVVTAILGQHRFRLGKTKHYISLQEVAVFWAVIWLGIGGASVISICAGLAAYKYFQKDFTGKFLANTLSITIAISSTALLFYQLMHYVVDFEGNVIADAGLGLHWVASGLLIFGVAGHLLFALLSAIHQKLNSEQPLFSLYSDTVRSIAPSLLVGVLAAFLAHISFIVYGLLFGLVVLGITILAHLTQRLYQKSIEEKTREIVESSRIHLATVEALATAIDARDQVGIGHVRRTQIYAVGIGEILDLQEGDIQALTTGALLHDIGKLGVPDHILNKPGRLTPAEMEKMKIHSTVGASILEKVNFPYPVIETVKYHHEMWNGNGYPKGLVKEEIPLTARILSVADAYDTLRGARPYRSAVSREEARRFLLHGSGTQFDPTIVDIFLRNLREFELEVERQGLSYALDQKTNALGIEGSQADSNWSYVDHIKRANKEVFALYELARVFSSSLNLQDTLTLFVEKIRELMPFDTCVVYIWDKSNEYAVAKHVEGKNQVALIGKKIKAGEGATGYVLKKRQPVYNINPGLDFSFTDMDFVHEYSAMAALPLMADESIIGAVSLYSCELANYEDEHMRLLETISRIAADAISKSLRYTETESHALTDPMTNLPNARSLLLHFENQAARAKRLGNEFQVIMLDLDGFKAVNDTFGHKVGDLILREISKVMRSQLREYDFLARYAGDEFVAIVPDTNPDDVADLCQRIEKAVCEFSLPVSEGQFAKVGVSTGFASYPTHGENLDQVIVAADREMYSVKAIHKSKTEASRTKPVVTLEEAIMAADGVSIRAEIEYDDMLPAVSEKHEAPLSPSDDAFVLELDESHIVSNSVN